MTPTGKLADATVCLHTPLAERWSPRGFDAMHALAPQQVTALLEAARWSPSSMNSQPWRFHVALRSDPTFEVLVRNLSPGNQAWAPAASALILAAAQTVQADGSELEWAAYDTGQAVAALSIQAHMDGLHVHQMGGFDAEGVRADFKLDDSIRPMVIIAVGRWRDDADLPEPFAEREKAPRTRVPLSDLLIDAP